MSDKVLPADKLKVISYCFEYVGFPYASAQALATYLIETNHQYEWIEKIPVLMEPNGGIP